MSNPILPGFGRGSFGSHRPHPLFRTHIVRQYGWRGVVALIAASLVAFLPVVALAWFNFWRLQPVIQTQIATNVIVKPHQFEHEQETDGPGETGLLQIRCEVPNSTGWSDLYNDDDPNRAQSQTSDSNYVRTERAYLRKKSDLPLPFGLLGPPPVSVWLPAGDYEIAVVHGAPHRDEFDPQPGGFPLVTVIEACTVENKARTVQRIQLPHYSGGIDNKISAMSANLDAFTAQVLQQTAIPTPGGYLLSLGEPRVQHADDHRTCTTNFDDLHSIPREWTREQLVTVRNWLPPGEASDRLTKLLVALGWRSFFANWYAYAMAGVTGLVFTRWGALAMLEPWRRKDSFFESVKLCCKIFFAAICLWILFAMLTDGGGCSGPVQFRMR